MSMDVEFTRTTRKPRQVALISLIDVMFVLLLFFMIAGHLEAYTPVPIDLPIADSGQLLDEGPVKIVLSANGQIAVNDNMFTTATVADELARQLANNKERIITIKADANLEANQLVTLLEQVRRAGGVNLSIVTQSGLI
jgi:biopolymer transport protein ExbD